jgi:hypothetical protein
MAMIDLENDIRVPQKEHSETELRMRIVRPDFSFENLTQIQAEEGRIVTHGGN